MVDISQIHYSEYSEAPQVIVKAPGHFHLIGEHSWFFKDKTLSMAIDSETYLAFSKRTDSSCRFYFHQLQEHKRASINTLKLKKDDKWAAGVKAVIQGYIGGGYKVTGINCTIYSAMLPSCGFGITTAIKIGAAYGLKRLYNLKCDSLRFLQVIKRANQFLELPNYKADNYVTMYSKNQAFLLTDYSTGTYDNIPFSFKDKTFLLIDLGVTHSRTRTEGELFDVQNALLLGDLKEDKSSVYGGWQYIHNKSEINEQLYNVSQDTRKKLLCIMREHNDILEAIKALGKNDFNGFAQAVTHSNESFRDFYDLSCPETNWILKRLSELNTDTSDIRQLTSCGRITGTDKGERVYIILKNEDVSTLKERLLDYEHIFTFHPTYYEVKTGGGVKFIDQ